MLFLADGTYLEDHAVAQHLGGDQWGMMNETRQLPRPVLAVALLVLVPDRAVQVLAERRRLVWGLMMLLSLGLVLVPFLPGIRSLPRWIPVHRLIWRDYYRAHPPH